MVLVYLSNYTPSGGADIGDDQSVIRRVVVDCAWPWSLTKEVDIPVTFPACIVLIGF